MELEAAQEPQPNVVEVGSKKMFTLLLEVIYDLRNVESLIDEFT